MTSIPVVVLVLVLMHGTRIIVDAADGNEQDISLSADTQTQLDTVNDVQELKTLLKNATKQKKKLEIQLSTTLNYAMFECALSIMKIDLEDAYLGQGIQKLSLKDDERVEKMPEDSWLTSRSKLGRKNALNDTLTCFLKWNAFIARRNAYIFAQLVLKHLAEHHGRELTKQDIIDFTFSLARSTVFLRREWSVFLDIVKRNHVAFSKKNDRKTLVGLLGHDNTLERWPIRATDINFLNVLRDALLRKDHISMWTIKNGDEDIVLPYVPLEMCPALEL